MPTQLARFTLYSGPLSMFGAKAQIAALEKGLEFDLVMVAYDSQLGYSPKHPEVVRINPKRQVPVLVHGDLELFDSTQIFEYLASFLSQTCISIEIELLPPELKLSGRVRISTAERESRSPLFSLSGNGPVCHPHAGSVCLGGCF